MSNKLKGWLFSENASFALAITGFFVLGGTIILFLANFGGFTTTIDSDKLDHFGSFIGGLVGAIWSLASFILLYVSLQQQKEDVRLTNEALTLQIEEFKQQKVELEGTKIALEEQSKTQELQRFESTFFNLLRLHQNIRDEISVRSIKKTNGVVVSDDKYTGKDCFARFYNGIKNYYEAFSDKTISEDLFNYIYFNGCFDNHQANLGHYFRNLYQILKFIKKSKLDKNEQKFYSNILRAQLSLYELGLLFYNCLSSVGNKDFKPLIEDFNFLENLDTGIILDEKHIEMYNENAFR